MTDRFVTVPDSLELPAAVKVPVARLVGPTGAAATPADLGAATAEQGAKADASDVAALTLTAPLALTVPAGFPAGQVYRVTITQDGTGGHTVTYGGAPVTVDLAAGASTLVEIWPGGKVVYPGATGTGSLDTEGVQDVVGAMVAASGGSYNDAAGTITLPSGGGGATVDWVTLTSTGQAITLPTPTQGTQLIVVLTQDATGGRSADWSGEDIVWEGGATPTVPTGPSERAVFTLLGTGTGWLGFLSGTFGAPVVPDTTNPTAGTLAGSMVTQTTFRLTVSGASDNQALHAQPYSFSLDNGTTWSAYQVSPIYDATGRTANTGYQCRHRTRDAAGNVSTGTAITVTTLAASIAAITDSFNRADSTTGLGTTDTGQTWEQIGTGILGIIGGTAYRVTSNAAAVVDFGQADMMVSHKIVVSGDYFAGHFARYVDANNCYSLDTSSAGGLGQVKVMRVIGGSSIATGATIASIANGDTLGVSYKEVAGGTEIKMYKNGVLVATDTDRTAGRPMGTKAGLKPHNNGNIRLDDFRIEVPA